MGPFSDHRVYSSPLTLYALRHTRAAESHYEPKHQRLLLINRAVDLHC